MQERLTCVSDEREDIAFLPAQRGVHSQDTLNVSTACRALGAEAGPTPHDAMTDRLFGRVVRRFNALYIYEGPQRFFELQDRSAPDVCGWSSSVPTANKPSTRFLSGRM